MAGPIEAKLRITADTASAAKGVREVGQAFDDVGQAATQASKKAAAASSDFNPFRGLGVEAKKAAPEVNKLTAEQERFLATLRESAELYGKSSADVLRYRAAQMGVGKDAESLISVLERQGKAGQVSAAQTAAAMRTLPAQMTDIVTQLQGGASPLTILFQQGGQIKDSFGGVGNTIKQLTSLITPMRAAIGGAAVVLVGLATAVFQGHQESDKLNKSLALTGGQAGVTAGQVMQAGDAIAKSQQASIGAVRQTLQSLIDGGTYVGSTLGVAGRAVTALTKVTGASSEEAIKDFSDMGQGVAAWAAKHNQSYNYLTAQQYVYIRSLEAQGRTQEAMRANLEALAGTMEQRAVPAIGTMERAWNAVGSALSGVWDTLKNIGRDDTAEQKITKLQDIVSRTRGVSAEQRAAAREELDNLRAVANTDAMRAAERGMAAATEQEAIKKAGKAWQDALTQISLAGSQERLANDLAALQKRDSAAQLANARGLTSARDAAVAANRIDQERLAAQEQALQRQRALEAGRVEEKPEDALAKAAALKGLDAQLVMVRASIAKAVADGRVIVETDALQTARDRAQQWAASWKTAYDQVRAYSATNAATAAGRVADPMGRAQAEADAKTQAARQQLSDQKRDIELSISLAPSDEAKAELRKQLDELTAQAQAAIDEQSRQGRFDSLKAQYQELLQVLTLAEAALDQQVEAGTLTTVEAERAKFSERAKALPQLQALIEAQTKLAATAGERNDVAQAGQQLTQIANQKTEFEKTLRSSGQQAFGSFFSDIVTGSKSASEAFRGMVSNFAKSMLDLIAKRLGEQLMNSIMGSASSTAGSTSSGGWGTAIAALFHHTGGVIGEPGAGWSQSVPASAWAMAPRFHTGGIVGLQPNERAIVGKVGEEVLTEDDPRHVNNGGKAGGLGNISIGVTVNGADGTTANQQAAGEQLAGMMRATVNQWSVEQSRPGGILFKG